jgi:hypothetical protein
VRGPSTHLPDGAPSLQAALLRLRATCSVSWKSESAICRRSSSRQMRPSGPTSVLETGTRGSGRLARPAGQVVTRGFLIGQVALEDGVGCVSRRDRARRRARWDARAAVRPRRLRDAVRPASSPTTLLPRVVRAPRPTIPLCRSARQTRSRATLKQCLDVATGSCQTERPGAPKRIGARSTRRAGASRRRDCSPRSHVTRPRTRSSRSTWARTPSAATSNAGPVNTC